MTYLVYCIYQKGTEALREALAEGHKAHFAQHLPMVIYGGSLKADDGETGIGSLFVLNCDSRQEVEDFLRDDPYHQQDGMYQSVTIHNMKVMIKEGGQREGW